MINVSQTIKNSCKADKNTHTEYIVINGQTIYIKGKLNATAYKDTTFFGTFNMKVLEFETENTTQFRNREFEYYKVIDGNAFKVGTFITTEVVDNDSKGSIKVTANDYALKFAVPYTSELDYSSGNITLYDVLEECCSQVGVELENKFIDNNSFKVDSNQFVNGELVGDVICAIAGISGNFATITNEDKLRLTFTNGTGAEQTTTINGSTQINASGFKDIDLLGNTTQNGTPTPTNPVPIETTTGRNIINVCGKNYANIETIQVGKYWNGEDNSQRASILNIPIQPNTQYSIVGSWTNSHITQVRVVTFANIGDTTHTDVFTGTFTAPTTAHYLSIEVLANTTFTTAMLDGLKIMFCEGSATINDYEPYIGNSYEVNLGSLELCKIGTYQDRLFKASGKNLANDENIKLNYTLGTSGELISNNARTTLFQNEIKPSTTYNSSVSTNYLIGNLFFYDSNKTYLSQQTSSWGTTKTFTTPNNAYYISFATKRSDDGTMTQSDLNALHIQLEEGSSSSSYEPYGNYWYKYNAIGKVVLDGSENWYWRNDISNTNTYCFRTNAGIIQNIANLQPVYSNNFRCLNNINDEEHFRYSANVDGYALQLFINKTRVSDTNPSSLQTWLSNNNTIVYYVLSTPTYTKIENEELIGQLDSIKTLDLFDGINNITTNAPFFLTYLDDNVEVLADYTDLDDKRDTQPITSVSIGTSQVEGQEAILRDENLIAQYGEHWLVINDNPFGYTLEKRQQLVKAIFDKVKGFGYSSFKSEYSYRPYLELGDKIKFKNKNGDLIDSAILRYDFDFDNCTFEAPSITSATIDYELSPDANELAKRAEIIANQAEASITSITQELQIDEDGNSQVIESIKTTQTQNSLDIEAITSYQEIDGERVLTGVKTGKGFTFNNSGLIIQSTDNTYKAVHNEMGDYYYDGDTPLGETTNEGSKFKNMDLYGEFRYGKDDIDDNALFVSMRFTDDDGEECFGHFYNQ